jgi:hypothetical protein
MLDPTQTVLSFSSALSRLRLDGWNVSLDKVEEGTNMVESREPFGWRNGKISKIISADCG